MRVILVGVGRLRPALREVCDDYLRRVSRFITVEEREVREAGQAASALARREEEDRRILRQVPDGAAVTLLDPGGEPWSSEQLAARMASWREVARDQVLV